RGELIAGLSVAPLGSSTNTQNQSSLGMWSLVPTPRIQFRAPPSDVSSSARGDTLASAPGPSGPLEASLVYLNQHRQNVAHVRYWRRVHGRAGACVLFPVFFRNLPRIRCRDRAQP